VRPLDRLPSIKLKLGVIIVGAVGVSTFIIALGVKLRIWPYFTVALAGALALAMVQVLARGMVSPLREMSQAAKAMSRGCPTPTAPSRSSSPASRCTTSPIPPRWPYRRYPKPPPNSKIHVRTHAGECLNAHARCLPF